jgi:ribosome biogenesis GTPase
MTKRRINHQQSLRIKKQQTHYRQQTEKDAHNETMNGLVIKRFGRHALIESEQLTRTHCSIRPTIDSLVAGDRIVWMSEGEAQGVVVSRYPRQSILGRPDKQGTLKPVAANISQIMIVVAPKPEISWALLDSYLVMAEHLHLRACIVFNKIDLACDALQQKLIEQYQPLGYPLLLTSMNTELKPLQEALDQQTSVFVGQSGVGKSSLIAAILPLETKIRTGALSTRSELGQHTTSNSCLYHIPSGGTLIDSPGVREFGLWHMPAHEIAEGYREFKPYVSQCKFRNCNHHNILGCALKAAVDANLVARDRYKNYIKLTAL